MPQNGQTNFKNDVAFVIIFVIHVWPFCNIMHWRFNLYFLLSVTVLSFKWGHRENFSLFIKLHEAERMLPRTKLVNKINMQEYPQVEIRIIKINRAIPILFWNIVLLIAVNYSDVWNRAWKFECCISFYATFN